MQANAYANGKLVWGRINKKFNLLILIQSG
jgi:hypothetical protein